jgi:hypothetical protein
MYSGARFVEGIEGGVVKEMERREFLGVEKGDRKVVWICRAHSTAW